ncbi:MAG: hypothetical protein JJE25_05690 [Bacteroidia bacterium]|nr:hypothetical protein [Bacteroidia bacterium]
MLKDIRTPIVDKIILAVVREKDEKSETDWSVYLVNMYDVKIENVLVSSKGYGIHNGENVRTSTLRHLIGEINSKDAAKIEPIISEVFGLNNEYWVSFYIGREIYDKKYIFLPESISENHLTMIPQINKQGVMIR